MRTLGRRRGLLNMQVSTPQEYFAPKLSRTVVSDNWVQLLSIRAFVRWFIGSGSILPCRGRSVRSP